MIPAHLHRVYLGGPRPETADRWWQAFQDLHPAWQLTTWEDPLDPGDFELGRLFGSCRSGAQLADLVRVEVIWRHGGVYVDCDVEPVRPFDSLLEHEFFIGAEDGNALGSAVFGARAGHPALRAVMDRLLEHDELPSDVAANEITGPMLFTRVVTRQPGVVVLPPPVFYPYRYNEQYDPGRIGRHSLAVHHWAGSWLPARADSLRQKARQTVSQSLHRHAYPILRRLVAQVLPPPEATNHACYVGHNRVLITTTRGFPLYAFADDRSLTPELAAQGSYDQPFLGFLARTLRPGDWFVDVGANIGLFSIAAARLVGPMGQVVAYEPDPETADLLEDSVGLNWLRPRVRVLRSAAGESSGPVRFARHPTYRANSSARTSLGADLPSLHDVPPIALQTFEVPCERVDTRVPAGVPIRLVKIDVEGGESAVIGGLEGLLSRGAIDYLSVECIRAHAGDRWPDLLGKLATLRDDHGGALHAIGPDGGLDVISLNAVAAAERWSHVVIDFTKSK